MRVLHFVLLLATMYGLIVAVQVLDKRWLLRPEVRERAWNAASWGAAVYWLSLWSFLGWGWVTRWRFDPFLASRLARLPPRPRGLAHRVVRALLGLGTGFIELYAVAFAVDGAEYVFRNVLHLPRLGGFGL